MLTTLGIKQTSKHLKNCDALGTVYGRKDFVTSGLRCTLPQASDYMTNIYFARIPGIVCVVFFHRKPSKCALNLQRCRGYTEKDEQHHLSLWAISNFTEWKEQFLRTILMQMLPRRHILKDLQNKAFLKQYLKYCHYLHLSLYV